VGKVSSSLRGDPGKVGPLFTKPFKGGGAHKEQRASLIWAKPPTGHHRDEKPVSPFFDLKIFWGLPHEFHFIYPLLRALWRWATREK